MYGKVRNEKALKLKSLFERVLDVPKRYVCALSLNMVFPSPIPMQVEQAVDKDRIVCILH